MVLCWLRWFCYLGIMFVILGPFFSGPGFFILGFWRQGLSGSVFFGSGVFLFGFVRVFSALAA